MAASTQHVSSPTVLGAIWRFRWFVLFLMLAFAGLGWLYGSQTAAWTAEATLNVQDPRSSNLFDQGPGLSPERYVEAQVAILSSRAVARRAVDIAGEQEPPIEVTVDDVVDGIQVSASSSSDIVTVSYTAETQREAIGVVNAVSAAYQDIGRLSADESFQDAIAELDRSIEELQVEVIAYEQALNDRQQAIIDVLDADPDRVVKQTLLDDLIAQLFALQPPSTGASDGAINRFNSEFQILNLRIATLTSELENDRTAVLVIERESPERLALESRQAQDQTRLSDLQARRDQLAVDADLASSGVIFFSPAEIATPSGAGLYVVLGAMLGLAIGAGGALFLANRRRRFETRSQPESVLGTRLLSDVPNFREERVGSVLPVVNAPASASAEAFRFVSASISLQQMFPITEDGRPNYVSVMSVSSGLSEGKTVVTANTAFAAAREGRKVLVIDADFGNQQITSLLLGEGVTPVGLTDVGTGASTLAKAVIDIPHEGTGLIHLLSRGTAPVQAPDFFASAGTAKLFNDVKAKYDLVLVDAPPLLRVAYATPLARLVDRVMVVIAHGSDVQVAEELRDQIDLVGTPAIGYVYNMAPLRAEMTLSAGSMADTLGEFPTRSVTVDIQGGDTSGDAS